MRTRDVARHVARCCSCNTCWFATSRAEAEGVSSSGSGGYSSAERCLVVQKIWDPEIVARAAAYSFMRVLIAVMGDIGWCSSLSQNIAGVLVVAEQQRSTLLEDLSMQ